MQRFMCTAPVMQQQQRPMMRKLSNVEDIDLNAVAPGAPQGPRLMRQLSGNVNMVEHQAISPQMRARHGTQSAFVFVFLFLCPNLYSVKSAVF